MGTNFYLFTSEKENKRTIFDGWSYKLVDEPQFGYMIHIAKTSCGWKPLFQEHPGIHSIEDLKDVYERGSFVILDEYDTPYSWEEFEDRVIDFNKDNPDTIDHMTYPKDRYSPIYFRSSDGYDFVRGEFS